jgi:hypothetical protein
LIFLDRKEKKRKEMKKTLGSQIVLPTQSHSAIPIVAPDGNDSTENKAIVSSNTSATSATAATSTTAAATTTKVVLKPSLKGHLFI